MILRLSDSILQLLKELIVRKYNTIPPEVAGQIISPLTAISGFRIGIHNKIYITALFVMMELVLI